MKLKIAISLSHKPKLLILDEPTFGLDPVARNELLEKYRIVKCSAEKFSSISSDDFVRYKKINMIMNY